MEFFLKHWDGYADNTNNTYVYNDVTAVAAPGVGDVKFKFIPWGIDQTYQPARPFKLGGDGVIAQLVRNDDARRKTTGPDSGVPEDRVQPRESTDGSEAVDRSDAGTTRRVRCAQCCGGDRFGAAATTAGRIGRIHLHGSAWPHRPVYILEHDTSECLHASNTESIPPGIAAPVNFEVYHQPLKDDNDKTDLWSSTTIGTGKSLTNQAYNRVLHASGTQVTPQGHKYLYTCAPSNGEHAEEFTIVPVPVPVTDPANVPGRFAFTGYFNLVSVRTGEMAKYGLDLHAGRQGPGPPGPSWLQPLLLLSFLGVVEHREAPTVVDDQNLPLVAAADDMPHPSGFMDRWNSTSNSLTLSLLPSHVQS